MSLIGFTCTLAVVFLILFVPRQYAGLVFLVGVTFITQGQYLLIGPFHFFGFRIMILTALIRILFKREYIVFSRTNIDNWFIIWAIVGLVTSLLHNNPTETLIGRLGEVYSALGVVFAFRCWIQDWDDVEILFKHCLLLVIPLGICMLIEKMTTRNLFFVFGGVDEISAIREGKLRAQGPFRHAILAGTVAASLFPMAIYCWRRHKHLALFGGICSVIAVYACASSGPVMTLLIGTGSMVLWKYRQYLRPLIYSTLGAICLLALVMKAPVWYLIARIDIVGGSTGYHRAALIDAAYQHLDEWWLAGTDYTRHWMPTGVTWSKDHTDITNQYIRMGVHGGLPFMLSYIAIIICSFRHLKMLFLGLANDPTYQFLFWTVGAILFAHCVTFISVAYFDQTNIFFISLVAIIASLSAHAQHSLFEDYYSVPLTVIESRHLDDSFSQPHS